jgi:hypothetical protein
MKKSELWLKIYTAALVGYTSSFWADSAEKASCEAGNLADAAVKDFERRFGITALKKDSTA